MMTQELFTVQENASIEDIVRIIVEHHISGVPVVDASGCLTGIVSEGDLLHKGISPRLPNVINILGAIIYYHGLERYHEDVKKLLAGQAKDIMTGKVITVTEDDEVGDVAKIMLEHRIKLVPVVAGRKLLGIVSRSDLMRLLLKQMENH